MIRIKLFWITFFENYVNRIVINTFLFLGSLFLVANLTRFSAARYEGMILIAIFFFLISGYILNVSFPNQRARQIVLQKTLLFCFTIIIFLRVTEDIFGSDLTNQPKIVPTPFSTLFLLLIISLFVIGGLTIICDLCYEGIMEGIRIVKTEILTIQIESENDSEENRAVLMVRGNN